MREPGLDAIMTNQSVINKTMATTPRTVVRDPDAKKRQILEAARRLLVERDFQDIVLDDVAKRAGVAKGTLFLYFKSKEQLFSAAFADLSDGLALELEALPKTGVEGKELLKAAAKVVLGYFDRNRDFLGHVGAGRMPNCGTKSREKLLEKYRLNQKLILGVLSAASKDEGKSMSDPQFASAAFIGLCRSAAVRKLLHGRETALEAEADQIVAFFLNGSGLNA